MSGLVDVGRPARQTCLGSRTQLMEDAGASVVCPKCLRSFDVFDVQKNRDQRCPVVPGHMADPNGLLKVELAATKRKSLTPRPF